MMGKRFGYRAAGMAPDVIQLRMNRRPISAGRILLGEIRINDRSLRVADPAWVDDVPALSVRIEDGAYPVYAYEWSHRRGPITVCVVIPFLPRRWTTTRRLRISNDIRPDLTEGVIVDTGEIAIQGANQLVLRSGLGDGYYPIMENRNLVMWTQSLVIDFQIWEQRNYGVGHGFTLDDYGLPIIDQ